jgi:hypothetical protein
MSDKKSCPLFTIGASISAQVEEPQNCLEERCAWFTSGVGKKQCAMVIIAENLNGIAAEISNHK